MSRIRKSGIAERMTKTTPRLVVVNSSTSTGRSPVMIRMRPTVLARLRDVTVGPTYLIIEYALTKLLDELEALPPGTVQSMNAFDMDPSQEDLYMLGKVPSRRKKRVAPVEDLHDEAGDNPARGRAHGKK